MDVTGIPEIVLRTMAVYLFLLAGVRLSGKREMGQLMPFELVLLLVLSNAVQNAMVGTNSSLTGGLVAATVLLALAWGLNLLSLRHPGLRRMLVGSPTLLIAHGQVQHRNLERERLTYDDLRQILREHDASDPSQVELAILEVDGHCSVIRVGGDEGAKTFVKTSRKFKRRHD